MIDWSRVAELKEEIGEEDFAEVLDLFVSEVETCLSEIDPAKGASKLEEDLHFLKGSALNLGLTTFAELCQQGESAAAKGDTATISVAEVNTLFATSKAALFGGQEAQVA